MKLHATTQTYKNLIMYDHSIIYTSYKWPQKLVHNKYKLIYIDDIWYNITGLKIVFISVYKYVITKEVSIQ